MKKNGFTLVELMGVIAILAIILVLAVPNVLKTISKKQDELTKQTLKDVGDAAISYASANVFLKECANNWEPKKLDDTSINGCSIKVSVNKLIDNGVFRDNAGHCDRNKEVLVYRYINKNNGNEIDEFRAFVPDNTCYIK